MYFELKKVPENLKLPLVLRAIKDPFAQNWVSSEYHKIDSYQSFKVQFSKLFWNEQEQLMRRWQGSRRKPPPRNCIISHALKLYCRALCWIVVKCIRVRNLHVAVIK
jgi:hypothetical protein